MLGPEPPRSSSPTSSPSTYSTARASPPYEKRDGCGDHGRAASEHREERDAENLARFDHPAHGDSSDRLVA
jgi:hypothetical protein